MGITNAEILDSNTCAMIISIPFRSEIFNNETTFPPQHGEERKLPFFLHHRIIGIPNSPQSPSKYMTGIADLAHFLTNKRRSLYRDILRFIRKFFRNGPKRFVVLCWRRTGSNWFCGMLYRHPNILMHNELFNETSIHSYYSEVRQRWNYGSRDLMPDKFLADMFGAHTFCNKPQTQASGFKSFPEHYLDNGKPNCLLYSTFLAFMNDHDVAKVILHRENAIAVYVSMVRSKVTGNYLTKKYDDLILDINIPDLQRFLDRYSFAYKKYNDLTGDQQTFHIKYEDLLDDTTRKDIVTRLQNFLSVSIVDLEPLRETVPQSTGLLSDSIRNYGEVEFAFRHTSMGKFLPRHLPAEPQMKTRHDYDVCDAGAEIRSLCSPDEQIVKWGLLVPIKSFGQTLDDCRSTLLSLQETILNTTSQQDRSRMSMYWAVDEDDVVYNSESGHEMITALFLAHFHSVEFKEFDESFSGKICAMWSGLAAMACGDGCDFFVLLGDDVRLLTPGWKSKIENIFAQISAETGLPYGLGCVAFEDTAFPGFPTFPVINRKHLETFEGLLLPKALVNQGGDPFLYALYNRFNASRFAQGVQLHNGIGGKEKARYQKHHIRWNNEYLTTAVTTLSKAVDRPPVLCLDVVVPTFRCEISALQRIVSLRASVPVRTSFWIIVDNPSSPDIDKVRALEMFAPNYSVNVREHKQNWGASAARNTGMDYSDADWIVLLDDDVAPDPDLLDAYIGGILRHPDASILVGSTHLPEPHNLLTKSLVACDLIGSYVIAERRTDPPWGVTANLCVRGRSSRVRFDLAYPKTGGGEDIDFCIRAGKSGITSGILGGTSGSIVSVPGALAFHPWWDDGKLSSIRHIMGWAVGESLCVSSVHLREHVYLAAPNAVEFVLFSLVASIVLQLWSLFAMADVISWKQCFGRALPHQYWGGVLAANVLVVIIELSWHSYNAHRRVARLFREESFLQREILTACGAALVMLQELGRCVAHLRRGAVCNLCFRFDWLCGKNPAYIQSLRWYLAVKAILFVGIYACFFCASARLS